MEVSLQQAIEIYARALRAQRGVRAPADARERAGQLARSGDVEGQEVWTRVAAVAETLPIPYPPDGPASHAA